MSANTAYKNDSYVFDLGAYCLIWICLERGVPDNSYFPCYRLQIVHPAGLFPVTSLPGPKCTDQVLCSNLMFLNKYIK